MHLLEKGLPKDDLLSPLPDTFIPGILQPKGHCKDTYAAANFGLAAQVNEQFVVANVVGHNAVLLAMISVTLYR